MSSGANAIKHQNVTLLALRSNPIHAVKSLICRRPDVERVLTRGDLENIVKVIPEVPVTTSKILITIIAWFEETHSIKRSI
jgi:hypothetical protein